MNQFLHSAPPYAPPRWMIIFDRMTAAGRNRHTELAKKKSFEIYLEIWPVYLTFFRLSSRDMAGIFRVFEAFVSRYGRYISRFMEQKTSS